MRDMAAVLRLLDASCFAQIVSRPTALKNTFHYLDILLAISKSVKISLSEIVNVCSLGSYKRPFTRRERTSLANFQEIPAWNGYVNLSFTEA